MTDIIFQYVNSHGTVSKERLTIPLEQGGLGLFDLQEYITGLQASWVKRAFAKSHDNWSYDLKTFSKGNPLTLSPHKVNKTRYPILHNIATSWEKFLFEYNKIDNNILKSHLLNNPNIKRNRLDARPLNDSFFLPTPPARLKYGGRLESIGFCRT